MNLVLCVVLIFNVLHQRKIQTPAIHPASKITPGPVALAAPEERHAWHWKDLESANDYRLYVRHLRAIGCPEPTIEDIVRGDVARAFAFKRRQLGEDETGSGLWSQANEAHVLAGFLGKQPPATEHSAAGVSVNDRRTAPETGFAIPETATNTSSTSLPPPGMQGNQPAYTPVYPVAFRKVNLAALGFASTQQAAIQQVQQQFLADIGGYNQDPSNPAYLARWQTAQATADDTLRGLLGTQAYMALQQQKYYEWFVPQMQAAAASGQPLTINPSAFSN